jgi:pyruvate dehydrogenase E2 component (dihydrolipoamide acetyltransferase)
MIKITIPKLGLTMQSAKLVRWQFRSGDEVKEGETIVIIETDKVTFEVPAPANGIIHPIAPKGKTCAVEETVGYLAEDRQEYERIAKDYPAVGPQEEEAAEPGVETSVEPPSFTLPEGRFKASPLARSMALEHNLNLAAIQGSGPGGRIVRADILRTLEEKARQEAKRLEGLVEPVALFKKESQDSILIQGVRKVIFENMFQSLSQSAQLTLHTEAGAEALMALRKRLSRDDQRISYNAILVKIVAMALRLHPRINASVETNTIKIWKQIHIGLAMEANDALIVPVVRSPDLKTIREIDQEIALLIQKARENRFSPDDLVNGTFTLSNLGFADVDHFTPIIRPPESAILGVGRIVMKPVVMNDAVMPGARISLSLTFDHRIIDGAPAGRFLKAIKEMVEDPLLMIM